MLFLEKYLLYLFFGFTKNWGCERERERNNKRESGKDKMEGGKRKY